MNFFFDTIIFDLGKVILDLHISDYESNFSSLGIDINAPELIKISHKIERGEEEIETLIEKCNLPASTNSESFLKAWNSILGIFPPEKIKTLETLKDQYNIYLLSNTNKYHKEVFSKTFKEQFGYDFDSLFIKTFYSHEMGHRKPEIEIYNQVFKSTGIDPKRTLFIDDIKENIQSGAKAGMQTVHATPDFHLTDFFA